MSARDDRVVTPAARLSGTLSVPGDKSVSHRLAMLTGLARGVSVIENFLCSADCLCTLDAVRRLGAGVERDGTTVRVTGTGGFFAAPDGPLDMGNSGTGMRLLAGLLAGQSFAVELTGDASLRSRPMGRIADPLQAMGADIRLHGERGCAPVRIRGGRLTGIRYALPMASAQVKSCILLAGLYARGWTEVVEPKPARDHTERIVRAMGVDLRVDGSSVSVHGAPDTGPSLAARGWRVPGDISSAAFWLTAAAAMPGAAVTVRGVGLNPRRTAFLDVLERMGAAVERRNLRDDGEPCGDVTVRGGPLTGTVVEGMEIPNLIDELPLVAVAGALAAGETAIRDAAELRVKESDRIATVAASLRRFGVPVEERADGMTVTGGASLRGGIDLDSAGDHRVAMAMAVLGLFAAAPVRVLDTVCVGTSYPGFWDDLEQLAEGRT